MRGRRRDDKETPKKIKDYKNERNFSSWTLTEIETGC
jgi:hypothetical protein